MVYHIRDQVKGSMAISVARPDSGTTDASRTRRLRHHTVPESTESCARPARSSGPLLVSGSGRLLGEGSWRSRPEEKCDYVCSECKFKCKYDHVDALRS